MSFLHVHFSMLVDLARSLIEILILATGIYYMWKLFKGTRGARVLAGFGVILATMSLLAVVLNLTVIEKLLSFSPAFLITALVIIFQPELRRIFAEVGSRPLLGGHRQQTEVIEIVIRTLEQMQQVGHGALIAFERKITYEPARETGTLIDAKVSDDLLETIFFPKTPLHDGGVIIVEDRIAVAAAIFPLTQAEGLQRNLGLRHRAALGLSDETDAVVVVLSEETGIISLAVGGELRRPLTTDELRSQLIAILLQNKDHAKPLVEQLAG
ncbi:MAG TPA: diadenylate cyclase CdaA [Candidatus Methylacidiphilales bacterium]|jgi:diadenylate cyclase|nr:diadenylate cyclase CdaA [Candidatus Methylacidiphilales bacterium]